MRIKVLTETGEVQEITLQHAAKIVEGRYLNRITDVSGTDHFFTHAGHYDGWGTGLWCQGEGT